MYKHSWPGFGKEGQLGIWGRWFRVGAWKTNCNGTWEEKMVVWWGRWEIGVGVTHWHSPPAIHLLTFIYHCFHTDFSSGLRMMQSNTKSIYRKIILIHDLIEDGGFDLPGIPETWLGEDVNLSYICPVSFSMYPQANEWRGSNTISYHFTH